MKQIQRNLRLIRNFLCFLGSAKKKYIVGALLGSSELILQFSLPYFNRILIDAVAARNYSSFFSWFLIMLSVFILSVPLMIWGKYIQSTSVKLGYANLYKTMLSHIVHMPYGTAVRIKSGDYITRLRDDADRSVGIFGPYMIGNLIYFIIVFPITFAILLKNNLRIAIAAIIFGSINFVLSLWLNPLSKQIEAKAKREIDSSASFIIETLRGMPIIRVFLLHRTLLDRYCSICESIRKKRIQYNKFIGITYGAIDFFTQSAQPIGFIIGVLLAPNDAAIATTVFNAMIMGLLANSIFRLSTFLLTAQPNFVAMERVQKLLEYPSEKLSGLTGSSINQDCNSVVELENINYSYDGNINVISDLSLTLHQGEHLAIVGESGGGKSTLIKLISGLLVPSQGNIKYFGQAGDELGLLTIRNLFAYVPQECTLFDGSFFENIILAKPSSSKEEVEMAAKLAGIHDYIQRLPCGYDTQVGEGGERLSGGQKQRLSIARALLKKAPVLLLDEATASLDSVAENEVVSCIKNLLTQYASVTVAHRLSTVMNADRILVIEGGKIVEEGSFNSLIAANGRFKTIYNCQLKK